MQYQPDGIRLTEQRITTTFSGSTKVRQLLAATPQLFLSPSPAPGEHHAFDLAGPSVSAHEVVDVLRAETVKVGGQPVATVVVRTVLELSGSASGRLQFDQWFDPSRRLMVKEHTTANVTASVVRLTSTYDATLRHL
jgi:hypothetical protein